MYHVPENLILFAGYALLAGIAIPALKAMPPQEWNSWLGWIVLPLALLPCVALFLLRLAPIDCAYRYIVGVSAVAIAIAFVCKLTGWITAALQM
jgi:hypothetical protein